jgi:hypothetical protein
MPRLSKDALLGASDLVQEEVELPTIGGSVLVQGLGSKFSWEAQSQSVKQVTIGKEQIATIDAVKLEAIQLLNGLLDPKLDSIEEAEQFMTKCGPAVRDVVDKIDELSGLDKEAVLKAKAKFPGGEESETGGGEEVEDGTPGGGSGPAVPVRTGA